MAQKVSIELVDDIDGSGAGETVVFGLDGTTYEIDLNDEHAEALREALALYIGHGRRVAAGAKRGRKSAASSDAGPSAREVREWARSSGFEVPERGRIPADVRVAFDAAN